MKHIYSLLGGHIAEKLFLGWNKVTTGCSNDLQRATQLAYAMIREFGMDEGYGVIHRSKNELSEEENKRIDEAVQKLLKEASDKVEYILKSHETELRRITKYLCKYGSLTGDEIRAIIDGKEIEKVAS